MLCPYVDGASGAGAGGRGGVGGRGGSGGTGGVGTVGGIRSGPLVIEPTELSAGDTLHGEVTYDNTSSSTIIVTEIRIAARGPGATHAGGPYTDLVPALQNVVIRAHQSITLKASRTFTTADPAGRWEAYPTHLDASGAWVDGPSVAFDVVGSVGAGGGGAPTPSEGFSVGTQEWYIASWSGVSIWRSGINWASAYGSGAEVWRPEFLADLSGFSVFRHMDTNAVNHSKIERWSQRKLPTDPRNAEVYIDGSSPPDTTGMALEWQIDLCNRGQVDCWFTTPYLADDDYHRQQATLIKAKLQPNRRVYIELSNEVWNGAFSAYHQAIDAGQRLGLPGSNEWYKGIAHEMYRALQMYQIYSEVFGAQAMGSRVIRVFSESGNLDLTTQALKNVYHSSEWNPRGQRIDMIALAPYVGNGVSGASETLARWKGEVDSKVNSEPITYALNTHVKPYGIPLLGCYEAGMHHLSSADAWARHPDAYEAYQYMLERFSSKMNAPCALYTLHGVWEGKGAWGLFNNVGQSLAQAPKARGTKDWLANVSTRSSPWILVVVVIVIVLALAFCAWRVVAFSRAVELETQRRPPPEVERKSDPPVDSGTS